MGWQEEVVVLELGPSTTVNQLRDAYTSKTVYQPDIDDSSGGGADCSLPDRKQERWLRLDFIL